MVEPKDIKKYQGIIFDFDGTLLRLNLDYKKLKATLKKKAENSLGKKMSFTPLLEKINSTEKKEMFKNIVKTEELKAIDGSVKNHNLLELIRTGRNKIGIFTLNFKESVEYFLRTENLQEKVDIIIGNEEVNNWKPHPEGIHKILTHWNFTKDKIIFIGNSEKDIQTGKAANVNTLIITF